MIITLAFLLFVILCISSYFIISNKNWKVLINIFSYDFNNLLFSNIKYSKINNLTFIPHPLTNCL